MMEMPLARDQLGPVTWYHCYPLILFPWSLEHFQGWSCFEIGLHVQMSFRVQQIDGSLFFQ